MQHWYWLKQVPREAEEEKNMVTDHLHHDFFFNLHKLMVYESH